MKLNGQKVEGSYIETVVIPRPTIVVDEKEVPQAHIFKLGAVLDYSEFEKNNPEPIPPKKVVPGGKEVVNFDDPTYLAALSKVQSNRFKWGFLKSLQATEGLELELVNINDSSTYDKIDEEFRNAGFSVPEIGRIWNGYTTANCLNESKLQEARKYFLPLQQAPAKE
jgi:hypothetical protein